LIIYSRILERLERTAIGR